MGLKAGSEIPHSGTPAGATTSAKGGGSIPPRANGRYTPAWPRASERAPPRPHRFLLACSQSGAGPLGAPPLHATRRRFRPVLPAHDPAASCNLSPTPGLTCEWIPAHPGLEWLAGPMWIYKFPARANHLGIPPNLLHFPPIPHHISCTTCNGSGHDQELVAWVTGLSGSGLGLG